jgi:regulator of protease activity HflC (stomatin/prohibitin superfamily)
MQTALISLTVFVTILLLTVRVAQEYQRAVVFRLGRIVGIRGPGLFLLIPAVERSVFVDMRTVTQQLDTQETVTKDGVAVKINAVLWYRATEPMKTVLEVADWQSAVKQAAETAMRDTIGQNELDNLLKDRVTANETLKQLLSKAITKWGVETVAVELKDLDIPENMQRAIAKEAEAVREKRARIIKADGEMEAAKMLSAAAETMAGNPISLELRRLQTLNEIGAEHNSTVVVAMPTESNAAAMVGLARGLAQQKPAQEG